MFVRIERCKSLAKILLNRPAKAHAYHQAMLDELESAFETLSKEYPVLVVGSTGERHFCAGADIQELWEKTSLDALELRSQRIFEQLAQSASISIAALQGPAIAGGFELALACDLRIAAPAAYFKLPELSLSLIPSAGGCTRLTQLVGQSRAKAVILGAETIDAQTAHSWGIVNRIDASPLDAAVRWGQQIAQNDNLALRLAKQVLNNPSLEKERLSEAILYANRASKSHSKG